MKTPYSADSLARLLKRVYPNERVERDFGTVRLLRNAAFDDFTGRLVVTPFELAMIRTACFDAQHVGYLKFSSDDTVMDAWRAFGLGRVLDHETHVHYSTMAERVYADMASATGLPASSGVYRFQPPMVGIVTLWKDVVVSPVSIDKVAPKAGFEVQFDTATGTIVKAAYFDGREWIAAEQEALDGANDWGAIRRPSVRKAA